VKSLRLDGDISDLFSPSSVTVRGMTEIYLEQSEVRTFRITYVHGFASGNFSYYVLHQPRAIGQREQVSRIARICQRDALFHSYSEIPLECTSVTGDKYNVAIDAYVTKPGYQLAESLGACDDTNNWKIIMCCRTKSRRRCTLCYICAFGGCCRR
jgi:hypothetical protein